MYKVFVLTIAAICLVNSVSATVYRVNSNLTTDANQKLYKTIKEAHDAAAAGDTLMIEGSPVVYAGVTLTKRLVLFAPGYFLTENPQTQSSATHAVVQGITIKSTASGTVLAGIQFATGSSSYTAIIEADNVIVMRCNLNYPISLLGQTNNVQIIQNFFNSDVVYLGSFSYTFTGMVFKNNIVKGSLLVESSINSQRTFSSIEHNIFGGNVTVTTANFRSNIVTGTNSVLNVTSANIQNNLVSNGQLPATNGNQTYNAANLFVGESANSSDGQYKLKPGSPYLTAGYNNAEPGIFGGSQAYVLSGLPPIPSIYEFTADAFGSKQNGLPITIKAKANQ